MIIDNKGFTLIETLVAINISLITISFIFSFYFFILKFSDLFANNYTDKYIQMSFFYNLNKTLKNCDECIVKLENEKFLFDMDDDTLFITKDSISLSNVFYISKIESTDIIINTINEEKILIRNCELRSNASILPNNKIEITSQNITSIIFKIERKGKSFNYQIFLPNTSIKRFKNIKKNN